MTGNIAFKYSCVPVIGFFVKQHVNSRFNWFDHNGDSKTVWARLG